MAVLISVNSALTVLVEEKLSTPVTLIENVLTFRYTENHGALAGIFKGITVLLVVFPAILIVIGFAFLALYNKRHLFLTSSLTLIISGGFGNLFSVKASIKC